jgi:proteasome lid subunit RPN8/RPN11
MSAELIIPGHLIARIREQAEREAPNEACGYLRGVGTEVRGHIELTNTDASPEHFSLDPTEQFAALKTARELDEHLLAVYHSHPATPARMSEEDIRLANDTRTIYVIHSLADGRTRGFRVNRDKHVTDVAIHVAEEST